MLFERCSVASLALWSVVLLGCGDDGGDGTGDTAGTGQGPVTTTVDAPTSGGVTPTSGPGTSVSTGGPQGTDDAGETGETGAPGETSDTGDAGEDTGAMDLSPKTYDADDPNIQYSGRIDFTDPKTPMFSAPGVYIKTHFKGVAAAVLLEDQFIYDVNRNFYEVVIDDDPSFKLAPEKGVSRYVVAEGLENVEHSVTIIKRTESGLGWTKFRGFEFSGEIADPPAKPGRRMVFIGDSITCGSGNEAANNSWECSQDSYGNGGGWGQPYHNNWKSYGAIAARTLGAEYHVTAVSGIGLVRNYSFLYDARPMPQVYDLMFLEVQQGSPAWDAGRFVPDVVVVALGTNDFSPGDSPRPPMTVPEFTSAYVQFVKKLRGYYPDAHIVGVSSPMLGDGYPSPTDQYLTDQKTALADMEAELKAGGDSKVHKFYTTKLYGEGCGTHPSVAQHEAMAAELSSFVAPIVGW